MFISTTTSTTNSEMHTSNNSTAVPPRLRQSSTTDHETNGQSSTSQPTTTDRCYRSILPRTSSNYYATYPLPPPLMATLPGVLFSYPSTVHQPGHIAYNIRTADEMELFAFQQQFINPPMLWPPVSAYPPFPAYGTVSYPYPPSSVNESNGSALNPDAAEWVPTRSKTESSFKENPILIDDEINFPPLNNHQENKGDANLTSQEENKSTPVAKPPPVTYSTMILQTTDSNKSIQRQQPTKDRLGKAQAQNSSTRRPVVPSNRNHFNGPKPVAPAESAKVSSAVVTDDWIEVKSKKSKKFDRTPNDVVYENVSTKFEPSTVSPPSSLSSTANCTSEDDDELSNTNDSGLAMVMENVSLELEIDYNQEIIDDIHQRLNEKQFLLILLRGCPGSGKSTLAKALNEGYNGQIFSTDEYFQDDQLVSEALQRQISPIIIDKTNTTAVEMKPYVLMGEKANYVTLIIEPQTPWRYKARELVKRNSHNFPMRRIKDYLNRFEHNVTIENLLAEIPRRNSSIDSTLRRKKSFDLIDDAIVLSDVRLCIDDMILFLTSNFYQTSQSTSSFSDLSSNTTPHGFFPHLPRCLDDFPLTKKQSILNQNNNNNNTELSFDNEMKNFNCQIFRVLLVEDCSSFVLLEDDSTNQCKKNFDYLTMESRLQKMYKTSMRDHSSTIPHQKPSNSSNKSQNDLLNIIRDQLTVRQNVAVQCSTTETTIDSDRILFSRSLSTSTRDSSSILPISGYVDCGIQVDLDEISIDSLSQLIEIYSDRIPVETIKQFYELCQTDLIWARTQLDEYLQHTHVTSQIPTLRQLSLNALDRWDTQIKDNNPSFDTISIGDLLRDINDDEAFEELLNDDEPISSSIQITDHKQILIPWTLLTSLQDLYGEITNLTSCASNDNGILIPLDDELSLNIYQALQRFVGISNVTSKTKKPKKNVNQQLKSSVTKSTKNTNQQVQSFKEIMNEELNCLRAHKSTQKPQLDFASQHKLKELEREFLSFNSDVLYEIFQNNEYDYDLTRVCLSSMLDENAPITHPPPIPRPPVTSRTTTTTTNEISSNSYEQFRRRAQDFAVKRKDLYAKADQANRHGMMGVASYYINQAHEQTQLMKDANRLACEQLCEKRLLQFRQTHRLDLHELYSDEALNLFKRVEQELCQGTRRTTAVSIEVITGYGKGSMYGGGCGKIRSVILAYLRQKKYKYSEQNRGAILVQLTDARH